MFWLRALELSDTGTVRERQKHQIWVVPAPFHGKRYISDGRYLPGDENSRETWRSRAMKASAQSQATAVRFREKYREQRARKVVTLRKIRANEE